MALCEIQWVITHQFSTEKVNHIDKVIHIELTPSALFTNTFMGTKLR